MVSSNCSIAKIDLKKPTDKCVIIKTFWNSSSADIKILLIDKDTHSSATMQEFAGVITIESLQTIACQLEVPFDGFLLETKKALGQENGLDNYSYEIQDDQFQWCKVKSPELKLVYGKINLKIENDLCIDLLIKSLEITAELDRKFEKMCADLKQTQEKQEKLKEFYEKHIEEQQINEKNNLSKFIVLLNEKKAKINQYKNAMRNLKNDGDTNMPNSDEFVNSDQSNYYENNNNLNSVSGLSIKRDSEHDTIMLSRLPKRAKLIVTPKPSTSAISSGHSLNNFSETLCTPNNKPFDYDQDTEELCEKM